MRTGLLGILSAFVLILTPSSLAVADDTGVITITMTGVNEISISLDKTNWDLGNIASGAVLQTTPPIEWCTLTVDGNTNVKTYIVGEDATWVSNPTHKWTLSNSGGNGDHIFGLWFRISADNTRGPNGDGYVPITKAEGEFWPYSGGSSLAPGDKKQFGLRLVAPTYFHGGRQMRTQITISAVAA